jgi:hypothetical protein
MLVDPERLGKDEYDLSLVRRPDSDALQPMIALPFGNHTSFMRAQTPVLH